MDVDDFGPFELAIFEEVFQIMDRRPWRLQSWLLEFARPGQEPGDHDSYNPMRRFAGWVGLRIQERLIRDCRERSNRGSRMSDAAFYGRWYGNKVRRRWWSLLNWLQGYKFGPVQRHRCCGHTTPGHGWSCDNHPSRPQPTGGAE